MALISLLCQNAFAEAKRGGWVDKWLEPYRHESRTSIPRTSVPIERSELPGYTDTRILSLRSASNRAELIRNVQRELLRRGYYAGETDGFTGPETSAAIKLFQHDVGAQPTGRIDSMLLDQLEQRAITRPPYRSNQRLETFSAIGEAQLELSRLGYYDGPIDGVLNPATRDAIRDYRTNPYNQPNDYGYAIADEHTRVAPVLNESHDQSSAQSFPQSFAQSFPKSLPQSLDTLLANPPATDAAFTPELQRLCGLEALRNGDDARALQLSNATIRAVDTSATARRCGFFTRGLVYLARRDSALAIDDFTSVLRLTPNSADAYYNRALAYRDAGKPEFARRDLREAARINPAFGTQTG